MVSYADVTGVWSGDDGGMYYIRQVGSDVWWIGTSTRSHSGYLDFFQGLDFTNVFHGTLSGQRISGEWADVSRGTARGSGTLVMDIVADYPNGYALRRVSETGGFGNALWHSSYTVPFAQCAQYDLPCEYDTVRKNSGSTLYEELKPEKDFVSVFGWVATNLGLNYPERYSRDYDTFWYVGQEIDDGIDGDLIFTFILDRNQVNNQPGFWTNGWRYSDGPGVVQNKLDHNNNRIHAEIIMYGRSDRDHPPVLPGWQEFRPNSVLWNGIPIDGNVLRDNWEVAYVRNATLKPYQRIRVQGVLNLDCGHWPYDCEDPHSEAEIHPVYAVDVVQDWGQRQAGYTLTGPWDSNDGGTYYIRQIGSKVWWAGMSSDQGHTWANVFLGDIVWMWNSVAEAWYPIIRGKWADVPLGRYLNAGTLELNGRFCNGNCVSVGPIERYNQLNITSVTGGFGARTLDKLYDR
jgi:hypothetical protein